jgi:Transcriptional regulatory protein, C terminal
VWDEHWFGSTTTLDMHVSALRRKLGESDGAPGRIMTLRGVAYSLRHHSETPHHRHRLVAEETTTATGDRRLAARLRYARFRLTTQRRPRALARGSRCAREQDDRFGPCNSLGGRVDVVDVVPDLDVVPRQLREAVERASVSW